MQSTRCFLTRPSSSIVTLDEPVVGNVPHVAGAGSCALIHDLYANVELLTLRSPGLQYKFLPIDVTPTTHSIADPAGANSGPQNPPSRYLNSVWVGSLAL